MRCGLFMSPFAIKPKLASRKKSVYTGDRAFVISTLVADSLRKNRVRYDELASGQLVGEYDATGELIQEIVWLNDIPVATIRTDQGGSTAGVFYIHTDHLNAPSKVTRPSDNAVIWRWDHDPFGNGVPNQDPDGNGLQLTMNLRFPGQYFDPETGLYYNDNRYYDPATGRYVTSDPIGLIGGSFSTYSYVNNNPTGLVDEDGLTGHAPGNGGSMVPILQRTYAEMKEKNVPGTDQFFHCLAACRAVKETGLKDSIRQVMNWKEDYHDYPLGRMGLYGQLGRFYTDQEMVADNNADKAANEQGLQWGVRTKTWTDFKC